MSAFSFSMPVSALDNEAVPDNIALITYYEDSDINISYHSVTATEDGAYLFSRDDYVTRTRSGDCVQYKQVALVTPLTDEYAKRLNDELSSAISKSANSRATYTIEDQKIDDTLTFTIFATIVAKTEKASDNADYAILLSASGGYISQGGNYVGSGMYVRSHSITMKTRGWALGGYKTGQEQTYTPSYDSSTWSCYPPSNWMPVLYTPGGVHDVGIVYSVTAGRGSTGTSGTTSILTIGLQ